MISGPPEGGEDGGEDVPVGTEYSIEYDTGSEPAENSLNPVSYNAGNRIPLNPPMPTSEDSLYFGGWYLDADFNDLFMEITPETEGDLKLYAKWQEDVTGRSVTMKFQGSVRDGLINSYTTSGTQTVTYRYFDETKGYYMSYDSSVTNDYGYASYTDTTSHSSWNGGGADIEVAGSEVIDTVYGEVDCYVLKDSGMTYSNTQWMGKNDGMIYKMHYKSAGLFNSQDVSYTLDSTTVVEVVDQVTVYAYADEGITVTGGGTVAPMSKMSLTAEAQEGYEFIGWMYGGQLYESETVEVVPEWSDIRIYALNSNNIDYSVDTATEVSVQLNTGCRDPEWKVVSYGTENVVASGSGDVMTITITEPGPYEVYIEDAESGYYGYRQLFSGGDVVRTYEWNFEGRGYTLEINMNYGDVIDYRNMMEPSDRRQKISPDNADRAHEKSFVTYKDPYIQYVASEFVSMTAGFSDVQRANFVLAFLQSIEYQSDDVFMGYEEYWKFPVETLYDKGGDCEDTSILYCAIVKAMGYDTALMIFPGHAMAGVHVDRMSGGQYVDYEGVRYYYVETTDDNARIGMKSPNVPAPRAVIPI